MSIYAKVQRCQASEQGSPATATAESEHRPARVELDFEADGPLFPASPVIVGNEMFVTSLSLPLTDAVGDEPEEDVRRFTVSRMKIPNR